MPSKGSSEAICFGPPFLFEVIEGDLGSTEYISYVVGGGSSNATQRFLLWADGMFNKSEYSTAFMSGSHYAYFMYNVYTHRNSLPANIKFKVTVAYSCKPSSSKLHLCGTDIMTIVSELTKGDIFYIDISIPSSGTAVATISDKNGSTLFTNNLTTNGNWRNVSLYSVQYNNYNGWGW